MTATSNPLGRVCLVTVGATVGFPQLTEQVLQPAFWRFIVSKGFTALRVQCGPDIPWASTKLSSLEDEIPPGLDVDVFDMRNNLMKEEMTLCKAAEGSRSQGLVITHAGTGTILDAWKLGLPMIVVPNTRLLNDHQTEMAKHLAMEGYATYSTSSREDLQEAIHKSELLWEENKTRWPAHHVRLDRREALRLWDLAAAEEVAKEENAKMVHD